MRQQRKYQFNNSVPSIKFGDIGLEDDLCTRHWIQLKDMESMEDLGRQLNENIRFYLNRKD